MACHTLVVLALVLLEFEETSSFNAGDKNVLMWAALLHDISKRSIPLLHGKDHVHPFMSGVSALEIFDRLNILPASSADDTNREKMEQVKALISQSRKPNGEADSPGRAYCNEVHSHEHLPQIFELLWSSGHPKQSFVDLVLRLIMFH